jgi:anaerobic selenocysteine-containing dehydrogenase
MDITRRGFIKSSFAAAGGVAAVKLLSNKLETLQPVTVTGESITEDWIPTTCWIGKQDCGMLARRINGRVVSFTGHPDHPRNKGTLCPKGVAQITALYDANRVKAPLVRTNEKGIPGKWKQVTWDEALDRVAEVMKDIMARDPSLLIWQKGRSKAKPLYDTAFVKASGATKLHHGAFCSDAGYRALEYTIGLHGVLHPDFRHTRYLLSWGWNITGGGGNKFCWLTWPQQLVEAKNHGIKVVSIDPRLRAAGHFADEWLPIRPGTDLALALALCNLVIEQGTVDWDYLQKYTNASWLVKEDGTVLRGDPPEEEEEGPPMVWNEKTNRVVLVDEGIEDAALEGSYTRNGELLKPAFQVMKEHFSQYSAEWAADVTGLDADHIRKVAAELGENALIGATVEVDGHTLPYTPVSIMTYHISQSELGFQQVRAQLLLGMLLGAIGSVGGIFSDFTWKEYKNWKKLNDIHITETPNIYLDKSKFFPINSNNSSLVAKVILDPEKYGVEKVPEAVIVHMANPIGSFPDREANMKAYQTFKFVAVIDPWLSATADWFADVVLPAATIEKYEGPISATNQYEDAKAMRIPPMEPMFDSKGDIDIYIELCEKAGILYGEGGYIDQANKGLGLGDHALSLDAKPTAREFMDAWSKDNGLSGIDYFETNGVQLKGAVPASKYYAMAGEEPFHGIYPHRLYGEKLLDYQNQMKELGSDEIYWRDYTALPTWRELTADGSPSKYDLYLTSFHKIEFKQSRTPLPMVVELADKAVIEINPSTAKERGIADGDEVWVESHNAITGETRKVKVIASFRESIRPDTVAMPHHYGEHTVHPSLSGQGPTPNSLFFTGEGYVAQTADQTYLVKVQVTKA